MLRAEKKDGLNKLDYKEQNNFYLFLKSIFSEPMILLLLVASGIYYTNQQYSDAIFLSVSILLIAGISIYRDKRSRNALKKLKNLRNRHTRLFVRENSKEYFCTINFL